MSHFDILELRNAFGAFMTGVTVVTTLSDDGVPVGFTANSYTSVSLDPPLLLVCPAKSLSSFAVFNACRHFAVNILAEGQQDIANTFASPSDDRFARIRWHRDDRGCPLIAGSVASFSCATHQRMQAGDHLILVGLLERFQTSDAAGLGYSRNGYFSLGLERQAAELPTASDPVTAGAIIEHDGHVLLQETNAGMSPPQIARTGQTGSLAAVRDFLDQAGLPVAFGPVYSIFENIRTGGHSTFYRCLAGDGDPRGLGRYVPVAELAALDFVSPAVADMMRRYTLEYESGVFGLYVGDDDGGDVHIMSTDRPFQQSRPFKRDPKP